MSRGRPGTPGFRGERLRSAREARGLSVSSLAELVGVSRQAIAQYESGDLSPSPETMGKLPLVLNVLPSFFLRGALPKQDGALFFRSLKAASRSARSRAAEKQVWLADITSYVERFVALPPESVPILVEPDKWTSLTPSEIEALATRLRREWGLSDGPISDLCLLLENNGVVISSSDLGSESLDAFSRWTNGRPYIVTDGSIRSAARARMNLAHELGHLVLHRGVLPSILEASKEFDLIESQAWRFATAFLMPASTFGNEVAWPSLDQFAALKPKWKVSVSAMIMRSRDLGFFSPETERGLWRNLSRRGWREFEPHDRDIPVEAPNLLAASFSLMSQGGVRAPSEIVSDLGYAERDLLDLVSLPENFFLPPRPQLKLVKGN